MVYQAIEIFPTKIGRRNRAYFWKYFHINRLPFAMDFTSVATGFFFKNYVQYCVEPGARIEEAMQLFEKVRTIYCLMIKRQRSSYILVK